MALRDAVLAETGRPGAVCSLCRWLRSQDAKTRAEWTEVIADEDVQTVALQRYLAKVAPDVARSSVIHHRSHGHQP